MVVVTSKSDAEHQLAQSNHPVARGRVDAKAWLKEHGCEFEALDITSDVELLREWRALTGVAGVPTLAHGKDLIVGFSPERYSQLLESCEHATDVNADEMEKELLGEGDSG